MQHAVFISPTPAVDRPGLGDGGPRLVHRVSTNTSFFLSVNWSRVHVVHENTDLLPYGGELGAIHAMPCKSDDSICLPQASNIIPFVSLL